MKILITGATGFVGHALAEKLSNSHTIIALSRKENALLPKNIEQILSSNIFEAEFPNDVDVIIHLAGRAHILNDQSYDPLTEFRKVNVNGTLLLAQQALEKKVKRFIFMSSIGVNGSITLEKPFTENDQPQPHADYALSKLEAEKELKKLFAGSKTELVIVRPPLVYAAHAPGNFARLLKLIATDFPLPFAGTHNKRSFVALENLVDFISVCIEHPNAANQTFLVADQKSISTRELVQYLKQGMGKTARFIYIPQSVMRLGAICIGKSKLYEQLFESLEVDTRKAKDLLDWNTPLTTEKAMLQVGQQHLKMKE